MEGNPVQVSSSLLWTRPRTSNIYKINEGPYCSSAAPKHLPNNIPDIMLIMARSVQEFIFYRETI